MSACVHSTIHRMLAHPLCLHLTRSLQVADKKDLSIEDEDKGQPMEDVEKNQLLLIFFMFLEAHPLPSLTPAGFPTI